MEFGLPKNEEAENMLKPRKPKRRRKEKREITEEESKSLLYIPREIIENILFKLPIKPLCRFKSVSKTWNSLISNLRFHGQSVFSIVQSSEGQFFHSVKEQGTAPEKFPVPWGDSKSKVYVSNSCNGMVLICVGTCFYLFNPTTHYFVKVLTLDYMNGDKEIDPRFGNNACFYLYIGLYYDEKIRDFKAVVLVRHSLLEHTRSRCAILVQASLKRKRWKHLPHNVKCSGMITVGPMVNGRIHWLANENLIRFNPVSKVFEELPSFQPPKIQTKGCKIIGLGILEECLCVSRFVGNNVEVLSMKEYGVLESWTPVLSFSDKIFDHLYFDRFNPLLVTRDGEILITFCSRIWVYNLWEKTFKEYCSADNKDISTCNPVSFVQNMDTPKGYHWNQMKHENFGKTPNFKRIQRFGKEVTRAMFVWSIENFL